MRKYGRSRGYPDSGYDDRGRFRNGYNTEYHARGTAFDRIGARMSGNRSYRRGQADYDDYDDYGDHYAAQRNVQIDRRMAAGNYDPRNMQRQQQRRAENAQEMQFNSAVLSGTYHNLDNPKTDVREYPERNVDET